MFWKKKKTVKLAIDERYDDSRSAFRISPDRSRPVILSIMGTSFHALNISGNGVAFRSHNFPVGSSLAATIRLPSEDRIFPVVLQVVNKQRDLCRCAFTEIHAEAQDLLHAYILDLQKCKIRKNHVG